MLDHDMLPNLTRAASAIVTVGEGRGFVVEHEP
jgi:hypothetical protein